MIPKINTPGSRTIGLLAYLYGPGKHEEHTDPHLVASFDALSPDPGRDTSATLKDLQLLLDQPVQALARHQRPRRHVWHCSVRAAPDDRTLTDDEWANVARRLVAATGIDPGGGDAGCRWAAVRHADDHIHIIATLVREDGRRPDDYRSGKRAQAECRLIETDLGLTRLNAGDGTAARRPTTAERHKADRTNRERTAREELRETVRRAVAGAENETEFFDRLTRSGLLIRRRAAPSGDLLGYTVALPEDRNQHGEPVFYSGSKLAPDLSLPRIRKRFTATSLGSRSGADHEDRSDLRRVHSPSSARRAAAEAAWSAVLVIDRGEDGIVAGQLAAASEILDALLTTSAAHTRRELREAAATFERASRSHIRAEHHHTRALRRAARDLVHGGPALGRGEDGATTAMAIDMLFFLALATANWHAQRHHAQQAAAARQAADHLRAAYQNAAGPPLGALYQRGRRLARPLRERQAAAVRGAVPHLAERVLAEPGWYALAATLTDAQQAGHQPTALLTEATRRRELDSAESISDVLVWRIRRLANLPANATTATATGTPLPSTARRATKAPNQQKGHRRTR
ncbi:relaxase/mobilization nuclease domain-containing protein [Streptomyces sp. NPDC050610]|uniref:relaxase/mobilization nuclease domain-containing protein n=1 Tax=Streptomyces sp. NPDC050610 TaxID=3157097 RepID=UPI003442272A